MQVTSPACTAVAHQGPEILLGGGVSPEPQPFTLNSVDRGGDGRCPWVECTVRFRTRSLAGPSQQRAVSWLVLSWWNSRIEVMLAV